MELWQLKQRQGLLLEEKTALSKQKIRQWYEHWEGQVSVSFSGGKDSTVLLHLVRSEYPKVPAVFLNTGVEYPEIVQFVKTIDNVTWLRPGMPFHEVIKKHGYPIFSKDVSLRIEYARKGSKWAINDFNGLKPDGSESEFRQRYIKFAKYINAPFKISSQCCVEIKEKPLRRHKKESGLKPYVGLMACESMRRRQAYLQTGCNSFGKNPMSKPLSFWLENDIWDYIKQFNVPYSKIYDMGEVRTGCMYCGFGAHLEPKPNRFQRMALTHPKHYRYCMDKLGMGDVLEYIGVPTWWQPRLFDVR